VADLVSRVCNGGAECGGSWTSTAVVKTLRPACFCLSSVDRAVSLSAERAKRIRVADSWARRCAMAAPMPMEAPVMRTVWSLRDMLGTSSRRV
jgi:hypothetical protein